MEQSQKPGQPNPAQAMQEHRETLSRLAQSDEARRLMELLHQQGGVQQAARAAAAGDPSALMGMMNRLMGSSEGADIVERLSGQAKRAGLE